MKTHRAGVRTGSQPFFPLSHGVPPRVDERRMIRNGLRWRAAPVDATHLKAHRTAASLLKKGLYPDVSDAVEAA